MKQRTIKFRGWFPEMKRMLYQDGDWCNCLEYATWSFPMCIDEGDEKRWNVNEECILMQSTGLLDKNGKEIYEGDVIELKQWSPERYYVDFVEGGFCFKTEGALSTDINMIQDSNGIHAEVIGNIYENPELLKS